MCVCTANPGRLESYVQGLAWASEDRAAPPLHVNDKLGVSVGESSKLVLVQVHDEEFVRGRELHRLPGELFVEVGSVAFVLLLNGKHRVKAGKERGTRGDSTRGGGSRLGEPRCPRGAAMGAPHSCHRAATHSPAEQKQPHTTSRKRRTPV